MQIVYYSIILNNHQANVADELWNLTGHNYTFVELVNIPNTKGSVEDFSKRPYLLRSWESQDSWNRAMELAKTAEVCVFSGMPALPFQRERLKLGLFSFEMSERWLRRGWLSFFSPNMLKNQLFYHLYNWKAKPFYKLCLGAFVSHDHNILHSFQNKCYKWGYFTKVSNDVSAKYNDDRIHIIWIARFLKLKHPELVINMAYNLSQEKYPIVVDMYGEGVEKQNCIDLVTRMNLNEVVNFKGNIPNEQLLIEMGKYDISLFTSDMYEGWGAVVNETMSAGSAVVSSDAAGSTGYLIKDNETGMVFHSGDVDSLTDKVRYLIDNPGQRQRIQDNAVRQMRDVWSPANAAKSLIQLVNDLESGKDTSILEGPCSKA